MSLSTWGEHVSEVNDSGHYTTTRELETLVLPNIMKDLMIEQTLFSNNETTRHDLESTITSLKETLNETPMFEGLVPEYSPTTMSPQTTTTTTQIQTDICDGAKLNTEPRLENEETNPLFQVIGYLNRLERLQQKNTRLISKQQDSLLQQMVLGAALLEVEELISHKIQLNGKDFEGPICISRRLYNYIHRLKFPIYGKPSKKRTIREKASFDTNDDAQHEIGVDEGGEGDPADRIIPYLWDDDLGVKLKFRSDMKYKETSGSLYIAKNVAAQVTFGTLTHVYMTIIEHPHHQLPEFLDRIQGIHCADAEETHHSIFSNVWPWTKTWKRISPITMLDASFKSTILELVQKQMKDVAQVYQAYTRSTTIDDSNAQDDNLCDITPPYKYSVAFLFLKHNQRTHKHTSVESGVIESMFVEEEAEEEENEEEEEPEDTENAFQQTFLNGIDTLLPLILEHHGGIRVYPLSRDKKVLNFYLRTQVDLTVTGLSEIHNFVQRRQSEYNLYSVGEREFQTHRSTLKQVPPPVILVNNITVTTIDNNNNKSRQLIFKQNQDVVGGEYRRHFTRDFSQHVFASKEKPTLQSDLMIAEEVSTENTTTTTTTTTTNLDKYQNNTMVGSKQVRFRYVLQVSYNTPSNANQEFVHNGCVHHIMEDVRSITRGISSAQQQEHHKLYFDHPPDQVANRLPFNHYSYIKWGSKIHRATWIESLILDPQVSPKFFIDSFSMNGRGFKRVLECHIFSLLKKYLYKTTKLLETISRFMTGEENNEEPVSVNFHPFDLHEDHSHCLAEDGHSDKCLLVESTPLQLLHSALEEGDRRLKSLLKSRTCRAWVTTHGCTWTEQEHS